MLLNIIYYKNNKRKIMSLMHKIYQQATLTLEVLSSSKYTIINKITMGNIQGFKTDCHRKERINLKRKKKKHSDQ